MYIFQLSLICTDWKILQDMLCIYIWPYAILKKKKNKPTKQQTKKTQQKPKPNPKQPLESNKPKPTPLKAQKSVY